MLVETLHKNWLLLSEKYFKNTFEAVILWDKIKKNYSSKNRYYHNLMHIYTMLQKASENKSQIKNYNEVLFAIWFHDIIYIPTSKKNEEKSADFAKFALKNISKENIEIDVIYQLIMSTKSHQIILKENTDNAFLLDFDLAILGADWKFYQAYIHNIRKEYKMYPNFLYNPARKKVLLNFLEREHLFFTSKYQKVLEKKARQNLAKEIEILS